MSGNQSHGRNGAKNDFRVRKSFSRVFLVETVPKTVFFSGCENHLVGSQSHGRNGAKNDFQGAKIIFKGFFVSNHRWETWLQRPSQHYKPGTIVQRCWPGDITRRHPRLQPRRAAGLIFGHANLKFGVTGRLAGCFSETLTRFPSNIVGPFWWTQGCLFL